MITITNEAHYFASNITIFLNVEFVASINNGPSYWSRKDFWTERRAEIL